MRRSQHRRRQGEVFRRRWMKHLRNLAPEPIIAPFASSTCVMMTVSEAVEPNPSPPDPMTDWDTVCAPEVDDTRRASWREWVGDFFTCRKTTRTQWTERYNDATEPFH